MEQPILSNKAYNVMKWFTQILLPAIGSLYFGMANIWSLPSAENVVGSLALITTFLGIVLGLTTRAYNKSEADTDGKMLVSTTTEGTKVFSLELDTDPQDLEHQDKVVFKVVDSQA